MAEKIPFNLFIDEKDKELYKRLDTEQVFKGKDNKSLFIMAIVNGYKNKMRAGLETKETYLRTEYLKREDWALFYSLAMQSESVEILGKPDEVLQLMEEYAHAGIKILVHEIESIQHGAYEKKFEMDLFEMFNTIKSGKDAEENPSS